jgi:hypothetical protein
MYNRNLYNRSLYDPRAAYQPKTTPRAHQSQALTRLADQPRAFALLMDMGVGKSKVILDEFGEREKQGDIQDLLIIAPAGAYRNWDQDKSDVQLSQFKAHLSEDLYKRMAQVTWTGGKTKREERYLDWLLTVTNRPRVFLINIEALSRKISPGNIPYQYCKRFLDAPGRRSMMVIDESTTIRNDSLRTRTVIDLGQYANIRRILTGLVAPKNPLDLFWQFYFLDWKILGYNTFTLFRSRYAEIKRICVLPQARIRGTLAACIGVRDGKSDLPDGILRRRYATVYQGQDPNTMQRSELLEGLQTAIEGMGREDMLETIERLGGYIEQIPQITGFKNIEELQEKIAPYSFRVRKDEVLDLPPKVFQFREVALTAEQKKAYNEILEFATTELSNDTHVTATSVITRIIKLHQLVCGHAVDEQGKVHEFSSNRITELIQILEECDGKVIIWAEYLFSIHLIVDALVKKYGHEAVAQFHGANRSTRSEDERQFLSNPECRFMVSSYAGALGNTWVVAKTVVYFANTYDLEKRIQSEDRSHRDGLQHSVTYIDLHCSDTVDEKIIMALRKKLDLMAMITNESWREWLV